MDTQNNLHPLPPSMRRRQIIGKATESALHSSNYNIDQLNIYCNDTGNTSKCIDFILTLQQKEVLLPNNECPMDYDDTFLFHCFWRGDVQHNALEMMIYPS
eukprot:886067_1